MIAKIVRGDRMGGVMVYLAGPGRKNEHEEPHLVAGDPAVMTWHGDDELDRAGALQIARALNEPKDVFGVQVTGGSVWHCSLSLGVEDGVLSDEKWAQITEGLVAEMGFAGEGVQAAPCRWAAVRHGVSDKGNDHVHIVVSLVREDGTKASTSFDKRRVQGAVQGIEQKYGLQVIESRGRGRGERGVSAPELARMERTGAVEPERLTLERQVRAAATAAQSEAEFVRRLRQCGVRTRPRFAKDRDDVVAGYSVAAKPAPGERAVWFGGGQLARDLTLPRLREGWPDTPTGASEAVAEWNAARRNQRPVAPGRETVAPTAELWAKHTAEVRELRERLRSVPVDDTATWARVAHETAGAFAAWSTRTEATPGPLAETARSLGRSAHVHAHQVRAPRTPMPSAKGAAMLLTAAAHKGGGPVAEAALLLQLANTMKALHDAHKAVGDAQRAREVAQLARGQVARLREALPPVSIKPGSEEAEMFEMYRGSAATPSPLRPAGSPVPNRIGKDAGSEQDQGPAPSRPYTPPAVPERRPGVRR